MSAVLARLIKGRRIDLRGIVQGVGLRPQVLRLARELGLTGRVGNLGTAAQINAPAFDRVGQHRAHVNTSHNSTRLLPESATTLVSPCMASA